MAINSADTTFAASLETVAGTTNASNPVFLMIDRIIGDEPTLVSDVVETQIASPNREAKVSRKTNFRVEGSLKSQLFRDAATDLFLESAISGAFVSNVAKAGVTDKSFTIEKKMLNGATALYKRYLGCQVSKFTMSVEAGGSVDTSFDLIGMSSPTPNGAILTGATYAQPSNTTKLTGLDTTVTVAGLSVDFSKVELSVEHTRENSFKLGSASSRGVATGGNRKIAGVLEFYREDWSPETVFIPDTPVSIVIQCGTGTSGYRFTVHAAVGSIPTDSVDGAKSKVTVNFTGIFDETAGTGLSIAKLTAA